MSLKIGTVTIDVLPAVVPLVAGDLQSSACVDEEIKESCELDAYCCTTTINEVSLEDYEKGWGITFVMVLLHDLRGLYRVANYLHHSRIRLDGDLFGDFAHFLTAASPSPATARIAGFLTLVFQPLRYEMVQAYRRLQHFLRHEHRPAVDACLREFDTTVQALFKDDLLNRVYVCAGPVRDLKGVSGVTRIKRAQKQQPLSDMPYGSSWHWNNRSFWMITSRHLTATWEDTRVAAKVA